MEFEENVQIDLQKLTEQCQRFAENVKHVNETIISCNLWSDIAINLERNLDKAILNLDFKEYSKQYESLRISLLKVYDTPKLREDLINSISRNITSNTNYRDMLFALESFAKKLSSTIPQNYDEPKGKNNSKVGDDFLSVEELCEALVEQKENPKGFQERAADWVESKSKKNFFTILLLMFVWANFLQPYFQEYVGIPVTTCAIAKIKEFPEKTSKCIVDIKGDCVVTIIGSLPYYYKVVFKDENSREIEGYVSKRSVKFLEPAIELLGVE